MASSSAPEQREVKLWEHKHEREMYENFADLFAIIKTMEKLEKAYVRDIVTAKDYEPACKKLIAQFRTLRTTLKDTVPDWERFVTTYKMDCPAAVHRLKVAVPATLEHGKGDSVAPNAGAVAETTQHYITAMDSLRLNMVANDQVFPLLNDLLGSMNQVQQLPPDFAGKVKVQEWLSKLYTMDASDELSEAQVRQLLFDLESTYQSFVKALQA